MTLLDVGRLKASLGQLRTNSGQPSYMLLHFLLHTRRRRRRGRLAATHAH
jgi:hypothetical protein